MQSIRCRNFPGCSLLSSTLRDTGGTVTYQLWLVLFHESNYFVRYQDSSMFDPLKHLLKYIRFPCYLPNCCTNSELLGICLSVERVIRSICSLRCQSCWIYVVILFHLRGLDRSEKYSNLRLRKYLASLRELSRFASDLSKRCAYEKTWRRIDFSRLCHSNCCSIGYSAQNVCFSAWLLDRVLWRSTLRDTGLSSWAVNSLLVWLLCQ